MPRDSVQGRDAQVVQTRQLKSKQRVDHRERLNRLRRVEIEAVSLVHEVETRPHDCDAPDAAWAERRGGRDAVQRSLDGKARENRGVGRKSPLAKRVERSSNRRRVD